MKTSKKIIVLFSYFFMFVAVINNFIFAAQVNPEDSLSVEKVLDRYIRACGGSALNDIKTETGKGTLVRYQNGQVPFTILSMSPGKFYYNQVFAWGDQVSYGFNGDEAWVQTTKNVDIMEPEQLTDMRLLFDVQAPIKLKELYPEMILKEDGAVNEKKMVTISAISVDGSSIELVFDQETGLLKRAGEIFFEDYRDIGPVKRPFRILLGTDEGEDQFQMKMQFTEILHNTKVSGAFFELPTCVLPVLEAPLYKIRKHFNPGIEVLEKCVGIYEDLDNKESRFRIFREGEHIFLHIARRGIKIEMIPESELDYYTRFLGWDFHFIKDDSGEITQLIINSNSRIKAKKIK
ncbi:MAG: hypothetical protein MIO92_06365 [Methanosarcinaceae archaeon]|nr:hypothetical protein [Methanosarcinaceae archaeon]